MPEPKKNNTKKKTTGGRKLLKLVIFTYSSVGVAFYLLQKKFMFHPTPLPADHEFKFNIPFKELNIPLSITENLNVIQFLPSDSIPKGVVLYFHGNHDNVNRYARYAENFTKHGYEIWIIDYPGYGKSTGKLTEENLYRQAKEVHKLASLKFEVEHIIVYGKSLGSGIASYLASNKSCRRLILETPYFSIPDLFSHYTPFFPVNLMSHFKLPTGEYLAKLNVPVTIFHGNEDWVIPYRCASKLKRFLKPGDEFVTIEKGAHNNLHQFAFFNQKLDEVLSL
jgi:pimeloyl-ACP methyl ester carboxylesterase